MNKFNMWMEKYYSTAMSVLLLIIAVIVALLGIKALFA